MAIERFGLRELEGLRRAGRAAAETLAFVGSQLRPGLTTADVDALVRHDTARRGGRPSQLGYQGFPAAVCTSKNEIVCHGIPSAGVRLEPGDIVNVDVTTELGGFHGDTSATFLIGEPSPEARHVADVARRCRDAGVAEVREGARLGDVGAAIDELARREGCSVVRDFGGHGIGRSMHADPHVPHVGVRGTGLRLRAGMAITIEPMVNLGGPDVRLLADGWTVVTADGSLSAQFEHTVFVTPTGCEVLTQLLGGRPGTGRNLAPRGRRRYFTGRTTMAEGGQNAGGEGASPDEPGAGPLIGPLFASLAAALAVFAAVALVRRPGPAPPRPGSPLDALPAAAASASRELITAAEVTFPAMLSDEGRPTTALAALGAGAPPLASAATPRAYGALTPAPLPAQRVADPSPLLTNPRDPLSTLAKEAGAPKNVTPAEAGHPGPFVLQVGSFRTEAEAAAFATALRERGHRAYIETAQAARRATWYRVRVGPFYSTREATSYRNEFERREHIVPFLWDAEKEKRLAETREFERQAREERRARRRR